MDGLIVLALVVGLIWGMVLLMRMPPSLGALATVFAGAVFGYDYLNFPIGPTTWTIDRLMLPALLAAMVIQRQQGRIPPKPWTGADLLLTAFLGWITLSLLTHDFRLHLRRATRLALVNRLLRPRAAVLDRPAVARPGPHYRHDSRRVVAAGRLSGRHGDLRSEPAVGVCLSKTHL